MPKIIIKAFIALAIVAVGVVFFGKMVFIRTVNYEIAGMSIPSKFNMLTGKVTPIADYKGTNKLTVMQPQSTNIGLTDGETAAARIRWAIFEQWASSKKEFAGWESDAETFRKANDAFKKETGGRGPNIRVLE